MKLLQFVVDEVLKGSGGVLKESVIGNAVYGRDPPYDPRIDSTVRVEARRLRRKLEEYYEGEGRLDPVRISLPTGGYVPVFAVNTAKGTAAARKDRRTAAQGIFEEGRGAALAIMPFRALSRDPGDESFADGLTDELIFMMDRAQGLRIVSRTTTFQYKDKPYSIPALAAELGVDAVLQGTVRCEDGVIRVTTEASDPSGFVVWSDRFDAPDQDRMRLQERIAATVLSRLRFDSSRMRAMQASPGPVALEAHAKVYRARQLLDQQTPAALQEAMDIFLQVAESAPDYARGHSGIADCYCDLFRLGLIDHAAACAAKPAVLRALEIDSHSVEARAALATISAWFDRDPVAAEADFQRALKLGENARAARLYGVFLTIFERYEEAERLFKTARAIEPFSVQQDIAEAVSHYQTRRFQYLIGAGVGAGSKPVSLEVSVYRSLAHVFAGDPGEARSFVADADHAGANYPDLAFARAEIEAWLGQPERGLRLLNADGVVATHFARATLAAALRDEDRSFHALEEAMSQRELSTVWLRTDVRFDRMRETPRFTALLGRLKPLNAEGQRP